MTVHLCYCRTEIKKQPRQHRKSDHCHQNKNADGWFKNTYLGYGESFGPIQFTSSVNALPDKYLSFVSLVHRSVEYDGHNDFDRTDELTNGSVHIIKMV